MTRKMKDSGIEWIGEIPGDWEIVKVKDAFIRKNDKANTKNPTILTLARNGIKIRDISNNEGQLATDYSNYNPVDIDDLLLNPMDLISGDNCNISKVKGVISPAYINLRYRKGTNPELYNLYFKNLYWGNVLFAHGKGVSYENRWTLSYETLNQMKIPYPPSYEQDKIAEFLVDKLNKLEDIKSTIMKEIQTLKDYKKSIITEAVTKGLDKNVEMKDSGIEWIGEIPKHWEIGKTLFYLKMPITDGPHTTPTLYDEGVPFVSAEAVASGKGKIDFNKIRGFVSEEFYLECCKKYIPEIDDVYMIKSGATTGLTAIVDTNTKFTIWSPLAVFRADISKVNPKFLFYVLQSKYYLTQVELYWNYGTQQNIGMRTLEKLKICAPPMYEQEKIVRSLDKEIKSIDEAIEGKQKQLEVLEEYKKSLIYEYVTGKKEVKDDEET